MSVQRRHCGCLRAIWQATVRLVAFGPETFTTKRRGDVEDMDNALGA